MNSFRLRVTNDDIKKGTPDHNESCAIALAHKRAGHTAVIRGSHLVDGHRFEISSDLDDWVTRFDDGGAVEEIDILYSDGWARIVL